MGYVSISVDFKAGCDSQWWAMAALKMIITESSNIFIVAPSVIIC
jgi:hypothetical protein